MLKINNAGAWRKRLMIATATEGLIRYEWAHHRYGQVVPVNWEASGFDCNYVAMGYSIDDAYNLISRQALEAGVEWLLVIEDDVLIPHDTFLRMGEYMNKGDVPVVSGLYTTRGNPPEPLLFRGRGNGPYYDWELGDKVWCDGLPMGVILIHMSLVKWLWENSEEYLTPTRDKVRRVFETPRIMDIDPVTGVYQRQEGTQDLFFFDRIVEHDVLKKTGWNDVAEKEYPFLCDTGIFCRHQDRGSGIAYPKGDFTELMKARRA